MKDKNDLGADAAAVAGTRSAEAIPQLSHAAPRFLCACVSDDAARCIALRYPEDVWDWDETEVERCECSCHDFQGYDE